MYIYTGRVTLKGWDCNDDVKISEVSSFYWWPCRIYILNKETRFEDIECLSPHEYLDMKENILIWKYDIKNLKIL